MKPTPKADFPVGVRPRAWEEDDPALGEAYAGVFEVTLNNYVGIVFVPQLPGSADVWDRDAVPDDLDDVATSAQARLATALLAPYVVTPNTALAGQQQRFEMLDDPPGRRGGTVFYVAPEAFDRFSGELADLSATLGMIHPPGKISDIRDRDVIAFIESVVLTSPNLDSHDAEMLGRESADGNGHR
jgi:hypothetical protein